jgi:chemotaxis protein CheX
VLDDSFRDSAASIVETIWGSTLALPVAPGAAAAAAFASQRTYAGVVQITGAWDGAVAVHCPEPLARRAATAMLGIAAPDVSVADIQDTLGELANMTGGNLKALLPEPCVLGLPVVVEGSDLRMRLPGSQLLLQCAFSSDDQPFVVSVLERAPAGAPVGAAR